MAVKREEPAATAAPGPPIGGSSDAMVSVRMLASVREANGLRVKGVGTEQQLPRCEAVLWFLLGWCEPMDVTFGPDELLGYVQPAVAQIEAERKARGQDLETPAVRRRVERLCALTAPGGPQEAA